MNADKRRQSPYTAVKIRPLRAPAPAGRRQTAAVVICRRHVFFRIAVMAAIRFRFAFGRKKFLCAKAYRLMHAKHDSQGKSAKRIRSQTNKKAGKQKSV